MGDLLSIFAWGVGAFVAVVVIAGALIGAAGLAKTLLEEHRRRRHRDADTRRELDRLGPIDTSSPGWDQLVARDRRERGRW